MGWVGLELGWIRIWIEIWIGFRLAFWIDNLIEYYVNEAQSYKEIAQEYDQIIKSTSDTEFGIIIGCIYSSFLQTYSDQKQTPNEQDIEEFNQIMMENAIRIKNALQEENSVSE